MAFKVTWHGHEIYHGGDFSFAPKEARYYACREDIPAEIHMDYRFTAEAVSQEEAFPPEVIDSDHDDRARGTIPRFTEVPLSDPDTD